MGNTVLISGASIAGPSLAYWLNRCGFRPTVVEKASTVRPGGYPIDLRGIAASGGSACQSGSVTPSHVLSALGVRPDLASAAIRMSLGSLTTDQSIDRVIEVFPALVAKARQMATAQ